MTADLTPVFAPRRVAVLGVSRNPEKLGHRLLRNLLEAGFDGELFPVNPSAEAILGVPSVPGVRDLPEGIDLALVSVPAPAVVGVVRELGARGCRAAVVLASGFGETGEAGQAVQAEVAAIARATGMRVVGPNCMGVVNVPGRLNGSYFWDVPRAPGGISFVSQSGAYGGLFFREARARRLGVARFLSIGNQADVGFPECLDWLAGDAGTRVAALFVEGVRDGRAFVEAARRLARAKAVVAFKVGRGDAGRRAAGSHTGSLVGAYATYRAALTSAGVVVADDTDAFFDAIAVLDAHGARPPRDGSLAILTVSGGPSVAAADAAEAAGLTVPALSPALRRRLRPHLPAFGADGNPVDMTPQMDRDQFAPAVRLVLEADEVAGALAIDVGLDQPAYGDAVVSAQAATGKPVVACTADTPELDTRLRAAGIPIFPTPERAVRAYRALVGYGAGRHRPVPARRPPRSLPAPAAARLREEEGPLDYETSRAILESYGVPFPQDAVATSAGHALSIAGKIGYPVVVKTARPGILHKTEAGGVIRDVRDDQALEAACRSLDERLGGGPYLIQEQVAPGIELLAGGRRDPQLGPTVVFGLGGVLAELFREVALRLGPLAPEDAREMLREGRAAALLRGFRGAPPCEEAPLAAVLIGIGDLLVDHPEVLELDVNPLIAAGTRVVAVDALIVAGKARGPSDDAEQP
ncbi:MAG TPA: acetate--CoA ligase family protein [Methylomirabilota bacterium]|nr:acetate--CoA ligase family protein [Methylomirabilota bacterium]